MTVLAALQRIAAASGHRTALCFEHDRWTYGKLWDRIERVAAALRGNGVRRGDAVAVLGDNSAEYLAGYFGAMLAGAMVVPLNGRSRVVDLEAQLDLVDATGVVVTEDSNLAVAEALPRTTWWSPVDLDVVPSAPLDLPKPGSPALCILTTGTTGAPKGVVHSHGTLTVAAEAVAGKLPYRPGDVSVAFLPFFASIPEHALPVLLTGGTLRIIRRFDVAEISRACAHAHSFHAVPTIVGRLLAEGDHGQLSHLDWMSFASEPMPQVLLEHWWSVFPTMRTYQFYGMSELLPITYATHEVMQRSRGTVGCPFPSASVSIVDDDLEPLSIGETGEVVCQSPARMLEYLQAPGVTAQALTPTGAMRTGDLGFVDHEGLLHLTGRTKDIIISGGLNIAAGDIEKVAARYPGVGSVAAVAAASEQWGETPVLLVVGLPGAAVDLHDLLGHCAANLAGYKRPTAAALLPELPTTGIGKADKPLLRAWLSDGRFVLTTADG